MGDQTAIQTLIARYLAAYEARDAAGCGAVYAMDALVLSPWGPPVKGRNSIVAAHLDWFEEGETNKVMTIEHLKVDGDLAVCLIRYSADIPANDGASEKVHGVSLSELHRQTDGSWVISCTSLNDLDGDNVGLAL